MSWFEFFQSFDELNYEICYFITVKIFMFYVYHILCLYVLIRVKISIQVMHLKMVIMKQTISDTSNFEIDMIKF